ncbi:MAG: hypothetical protein ACRD11_11895 [Terriglobia bacterium]
MYAIATCLILIALVVLVGAAFFLGSVIVLLLEAGSEAITSFARRHVHAVADIKMQPHEPSARTRMHG